MLAMAETTTSAAYSAPFDYASVTTEDIARECDAAIVRCDAILDQIASVEGERTFENTLSPLDGLADVLSTVSGRYGFLTYVAADEAIRQIALDYEQKLDTYATGVGFREDLYAALLAFAATDEARALEGEAARLLDHSLRDFRRNGFELGPDERARVQQLKERLVALGVEFRRNIDEYEDALWLRREQLAGLPDSYVERLQTEEVEDGLRYRVSLEYPEMFPFMEAAEDEQLRHELFRKNHNKAADLNLPLLAEAIAVRDEIAEVLGYDSWAAYVLEIKMAKTPAAVHDFLVDLYAKVKVKADRDLSQLAASKGQETGDAAAQLELWDWRYQMQRVLRVQYEVDQFAVAEYFPLEAVLKGLFDVYQRLVGVRFVPIEDAQAWHEDVRLYAIENAEGGEHIAHFYMDLHPRPDKYGHAAAFSLRLGRELPDGGFQTPISSIVANFTKPTSDSPALLRHSEVETLFHEFGHILHQTMTRARFARFSGTHVERDFVEAPSQMLEHWVWDAEVLTGFTRHVESGEPLPSDLLDRMLAAKNVASGVHYLRQLYFARLDLAYHLTGRDKDTDAIAEELHALTGFPFEPGTHFQAGFGHLFGYDAGYYGYLWSKVFGDDMFTRFEGDPAAAGADYRRLILERGGSVDGADMLREFLGRDPQPEAFLRGIGLEVG